MDSNEDVVGAGPDTEGKNGPDDADDADEAPADHAAPGGEEE